MNTLVNVARNAVATYEAPTAVVELITIKNAVTLDELFERVAEASATSTDIARLMKRVGHALTKQELAMVEYAKARADYREGRPVTVKQLMLLGSMSVQQIAQHMKMLGMRTVSAYFSNEDATRIMMRSTVEQ